MADYKWLKPRRCWLVGLVRVHHRWKWAFKLLKLHLRTDIDEVSYNKNKYF